MATSQHYVWAAGHFILLIAATKYLLSTLMFRSPGYQWYNVSYLGALVSYAIVCHKSLGFPQPNAAYAKRAAVDENVQYFILALFWWFSKPVAISLIPFVTFSLFHALTFLRSNILPRFFPPTAPATAGAPAQQHPILKQVQTWIKSNYDRAMRVVAYTELVILARVIFGAIFRQNSLLSPLIYAHFLRQRYYHSIFTQRAVAHVNQIIDVFARRPGNPPAVAGVWEKIQGFLSGWVGTVLVNQQQPAAAAAGAGAGGRRPPRG